MTRKAKRFGTALVVQWLRLHASNAGDAGSIPGLGNKIPHATGHSQKKRKAESFDDVTPLTLRCWKKAWVKE